MKTESSNPAYYQFTLLILCIIMLSGNIFAQDPVQNILNTPINQIVIKGNINLYILQAPEQSLRFEGNKNSVKQIKTSIKNKTLSITKNYTLNDDRVQVFITLNDIESIITIGNVRIETPTNIWLNKLKLKLSEETVSVFYINSNLLNLDVSGSGDVNISGYIDTLKITSNEEAEIVGNIKTVKLFCRAKDYSNITLEGTIFKAFLSGFEQSNIDLTEAESGMCSIVAFDNSKIKVTSIDVTDIYAFDNSIINYRSANKAFILENSHKAIIKQDKTIAKK